MSGPAPRKPPVDAYPLLKPDEQRKVDSAPRAERAVFAWLLLIVGQDGWRERKTSCLICSKSGWPCIDPERRGTRKRCEGCWIAGYHCHTPAESPEPEQTAPPSTPPRNRSKRARKTHSKHHKQQYSESSDEHMDVDDSPKGKQKKKTKRRAESCDSEAESGGPGVGTRSTRHKAQHIKGPSKRRRIESSPETKQAASSDIEFISAHERERARMTPIPPRKPGDRHQVSHASPNPAPPVKTAAERFQELLGDDSSSDSDNSSDSSDSAPLPPRPLPVRPVPGMSATRTALELSTSKDQRTPRPTGRRDTAPDQDPDSSDSSDDSRGAGAAPRWKYSKREPSKAASEADAQDGKEIAIDNEADELDIDVKKEDEVGTRTQASARRIKQEHERPAKPEAPLPSHETHQSVPPPPVILDNSQQLTITIVRQILTIAQQSASPSFALSFDGDAAAGLKDKTVIVVPETTLANGDVVPWHVLLCERGQSRVYVVFKRHVPTLEDSPHSLYAVRTRYHTMPRSLGLAVPQHPCLNNWKPCRQLGSTCGPLWTTVVAVWLTRGGNLSEKLDNLKKLRIREDYAIVDLNRLLQGQEWTARSLSGPSLVV